METKGGALSAKQIAFLKCLLGIFLALSEGMLTFGLPLHILYSMHRGEISVERPCMH